MWPNDHVNLYSYKCISAAVLKKLTQSLTYIMYAAISYDAWLNQRKLVHIVFCLQDKTDQTTISILDIVAKQWNFRKAVSSNNKYTRRKILEPTFLHNGTITFDISLGRPPDPTEVMSTTVPPVDDMSITVAPTGVVLVYKPGSRTQLLRKSAEPRSVWGIESSFIWCGTLCLWCVWKVKMY